MQTSNPSIPGRVKSKMIKSNFLIFKAERAKKGSSKFVTSILNCFKYKDKTSASSKSSSIIAIFIKATPFF